MDRPVEILLVEDNPDDVELTLRALRRHNLANDVLVASDGAEALDFLYAGDSGADEIIPRLIILDLHMPKVDGLEVLRRLKADARTRSFPVVILTSSAEDRDLVDSYALGTNSYIVKPVDFDDFVRVVKEIGMYWLLLNRKPD